MKQQAYKVFVYVLWSGFVLIVAGVLYARDEFSVGDPIQYSTRDGLSNNYITALLQDQTGFLWVATGDGLNRYDGYEFLRFTPETDDPWSLKISIIYALTEDPFGYIWVGGNGGFAKYDPASGRFTNYLYSPSDQSIPAERVVTSLYASPKGILWIGYQNMGLDGFDIQSQEMAYHAITNISATPDNVRQILPSEEGNLWIGADNGLFQYKINSHQLDKIPVDGCGPGSPAVYNLLELGSELWLATAAGLVVYDTESKQCKPFAVHNNILNNYFQSRFNTLILLPDDKILVLNRELGPGIIDQNTGNFNLFGPELLEKTVQTVFNTAILDRFGLIWLGTPQLGLISLDTRSQPIIPVSMLAGISQQPIYSIVENDGMIYWTSAGGLYSSHAPVHGHAPLPQAKKIFEKPGEHFFKLFRQSNGPWWMGSNGLYQMDILSPQVVLNLYQPMPEDPVSLSDWIVWTIAEDAAGNLWVGTGNGVNRMETKNGTVSFSRLVHDEKVKSSLSGKRVWYITNDNNSHILACTDAALNRINTQTLEVEILEHIPDVPTSLSSGNVISALRDSQGTLWVGTEGGGLNRQTENNQNSFVHYTTRDGLPDNTIWSIMQDDNHLWLSTNNGLARMRVYDQNMEFLSTPDIKTLGEKTGFFSNQFLRGAFHKGSSGLFYYGNNKGLFAFHPDSLVLNPVAPVPVLNQLIIQGNPVLPGDTINGQVILTQMISSQPNIRLIKPNNSFSIGFGGLHFSSPENNKFAYMLEGFEKEWIYTDSSKRFANYRELPSGNYVFLLRVANADGVWSETSSSLNIKISRSFQHIRISIFIGLAAIISLVVVLLFFKKQRARFISKDEHAPAEKFSSPEDPWVLKAREIVFKNLSNSDFSVDIFARQMAASRSMLHTKLKKKTGQSAGDFIRDMRLEKALELLKNEHLSVKETAWQCGFSDASYFTKCFKQKYGKLPSEAL